MANNKNKADRLHDQLPPFFKTRSNPNWKAIVEAIGEQDQFVADLIENVRKQFFVKTASRPYLDRLGANNRVNRPRFIGMDDPTFRNYIPVLAYQPKQVKLIIDQLLDIFFFKESTTAFIETGAAEPFALSDGWELEYTIDSFKTSRIQFNASDFVTIGAATAEEVVAAINRQTQDSFAIVFNNSVTKQKTIRLFTNTIGSKGSIQINGGRADIALRFNGFISDAGTGANTQWTVTKVGDLVTFQHTAGNAPGIEFIDAGDIFISDILNNKGSFVIEHVDLSSNKFTFRNLFGTPGVFTQTSSDNTKFIHAYKAVVYTNNTRRAISWEVSPGTISVEMPASPPVVRRSLAGSSHINGLMGVMTNRVSNSSLTLDSVTHWPLTGTFQLQEQQEIQARLKTISENVITSNKIGTRIIGFDQRYEYTGITGNTLTGITPDLPEAAGLNEYNIASLSRDTFNNLTIVVSGPHNFKVDDYVIIQDSVAFSGFIVSQNGTWKITQVVNPNTVVAFSPGDAGTANATGTARVERVGLSNSGSRVLLEDAVLASITGIKGPYIWDLAAPFVLSSLTGSVAQLIHAGQSLKTIDLGVNNLAPEGGQVIFDFGTEFQEGPVRYLFKPSVNSIAIDPAYVFQNDHISGSAITAIRHKGPHQMSGRGTEFAPYVTDPTVARAILEDLILQVKSVGIFVEFLIRYPEQLYATLDVYNSGIDPG